MTVCISVARENLTLYIVISQGSLPVRENLKKRGVRFAINFILKTRSKHYINAKFFLDYIRTVLLPNLNELRALEESADEDAVPVMDNARAMSQMKCSDFFETPESES
jgi:hypothetical protein